MHDLHVLRYNSVTSIALYRDPLLFRNSYLSRHMHFFRRKQYFQWQSLGVSRFRRSGVKPGRISMDDPSNVFPRDHFKRGATLSALSSRGMEGPPNR